MLVSTSACLPGLRKLLRRRAEIKALRRSRAFDEAWYRTRYLEGHADIDPIRHYVTQGQGSGQHPDPLFDVGWYLWHNTDVRSAGIDPFLHYVTCGAREGRLPNPWVHAGDRSQVEGLRRFLLEATTRQTVGMVEIRSPGFVSGWFASRSETQSPEIVVGGRVGRATLFNSRPDVARLLGRPAHGFLFAFETPLDDETEVIVRFGDGTVLHGSPCKRLMPPASTRRDPEVHFDRLDRAITRRLVDIAGWVGLGHGTADVEIKSNGRRQRAFFGLRTDVIEALHDPFFVGFDFTFDAAEACARGENSLDLEICVDGQIVESRRLPIALAPVSGPRRNLQLFMHIPKTAGISIGNAVKSVPHKRSLWLYDRGATTIGEQLAGLSTGALDDVDIVGGHFPFGLHRVLPRPCDYVAFLREPASYIKSFHLFMRYVARVPEFLDDDLFVLVEDRPEFDNAFVRWFAEVPGHRRVDQADLDRAVATMDRDFVFIGLLERMEESMARLSALWGAELPVLLENRTPPVAEAATIDVSDIARRAPAAIRYDTLLYERAKVRFWG